MGPTGSVAPTGSRESSEAAPGGIVTGPAGGAVPSPGMTLNLKPSSVISAPTSPASKGVSSFLSRATSLTGSVTSTVQQIARATSQAAAAAIKDRYKILLVIDEQLIDWSVITVTLVRHLVLSLTCFSGLSTSVADVFLAIGISK